MRIRNEEGDIKTPESDKAAETFGWASSSLRSSKAREGSGTPYSFAETLLPEIPLEKLARPSMKIFIWLLIFGIAMAFLESAVVYYLRNIWEITSLFPMIDISKTAEFQVEYGREIATIVMLASISMALGRNIWQRAAFFLFLFGVWDIFYYVWLYVLVGWPAGVLDWDILFFVPVLLVSPVYAPVVISLFMIFYGMMIIYAQRKHVVLKSSPRFWIMEVIALGMVYVSLAWDPLFGVLSKDINGLPADFPWLMFVVGLVMSLTAFLFLISECFKLRKFDFNLYVSKKI